ncbi:4-(cytidine 5'-diphospho)-2-C-methyl-D-erythritol kinase, partial [Staphylococcus aureus]|nr:4-(cytidine 5'-diphospho)-2-C-methyl-D-erythritol kinase [Staphylococcus aureus]
DVFKALDLDDTHHVDTEMCEQAIVNGNYQQLCQSLSNRLEPVSMSMHPEIRKIKNNMLQCGADGALMSGSGPTVYGLAQKESQAK